MVSMAWDPQLQHGHVTEHAGDADNVSLKSDFLSTLFY